MSKFSKHREKPTMKPKEGVLLVSDNGVIFELSTIFEENGQRMVTVIINDINDHPYPVREVVEHVRNGTWKIVKEGPIEPEKILKQFNFI